MTERIFLRLKKVTKHLTAPWRGSILQFIAAGILPLTVLLAAITFGSFSIHQDAMRTMVGDRDRRSVDASVRAIETELDHRLYAISTLSSLAAGKSREALEQVLLQTVSIAGDFNYGVAFFDQAGNLFTHRGESEFWQALREQPGFTSFLNANSPTGVSMEFVHPKDGVSLLLVLSPAQGSDLVAVGAFSAENLVGHILRNNFSSDGHTAIYLIDVNYRVVYQSGPYISASEVAKHPGVAEALKGQKGATYIRAGNDEHVIAYSQIPALRWAILSEESWEMLANPTLTASQIAPLVLIPALLFSALALWFGAEQIVRPLRALEAKAAQLAWGEFDEIEKPVSGIAEIRHLQAELIHMARQLRTAQQSLHSYIGAITKAQEEERLRLAHDLHDDTIQSVIALKQRVQLARMALPKDTFTAALSELEGLAEQTIENLRRTTRALRPIYLEDLGLRAALEMLASELTQNVKLQVDFHCIGEEYRLPADVELALYRMAQEALNNTVRHAHATHAAVSVEFKPELVRLHIGDNGVGFDVPQSPAEFVPGSHFGLIGLYERAQLIGARLEIISSPDKGTILEIHCSVTK